MRLCPARWAGLLYGVLAGSVLVCAWALLTKVFPAALAPDETFARLRAPFDYWNSVGLTAALAVPPLLWLAARRSGHGAVNALAWPRLGLVLVCLMLSYSRGALLALAIGLAVWFAVVPLRLRAVAALGGSALAAVPVVVWAFAQDGLTVDRAPMAAARRRRPRARRAAAAAASPLLGVAGLAVGFFTTAAPAGRAHAPPAPAAACSARSRSCPSRSLIALAASPGRHRRPESRGLEQAHRPAGAHARATRPDRLTATSSVRARYWREALKVHARQHGGRHRRGRLRDRAHALPRRRRRDVRHAHGYVVQTLADLGWVGLGLSLLAGARVAADAPRARSACAARDRGLPWDAERVGLWTLAAVRA